MVRWNIIETTFLFIIPFILERVFTDLEYKSFFTLSPLLVIYRLFFCIFMFWSHGKKYITQYSSLFYVSNVNGSRLILNVFCIRYIRKSSWKNGTHQVLEKYISYIITHCKYLSFHQISIVWLNTICFLLKELKWKHFVYWISWTLLNRN